MPPPFTCIRKKNTMDEEDRKAIVMAIVIAILFGIVYGITVIHGHLADGRQAKWQAQVDSMLSGLDSIPVTVSVTDRWVKKIDSVWLECPVTVSVTDRWMKKIGSGRLDSEEVFVGAYSNTDSNAAQKYLSDWLNATKSFCSRKTNAYTEYKTCMELVTAKATVTRKPGRPSAPPRQYTYNKFYERHSIPYPGDPRADIYLLDASTDVDWRDDSTMVTVRSRVSNARLHYNYRTDRWELQGAGRVKATGMNYNQFAESIKSAYPEYADRDNAELARAVIAKYPVYADRVDTAGLGQSQPSNQALNKGEQR